MYILRLLSRLFAKTEVDFMAKKKLMSARLKEEIAKDLGFYSVVEQEGWGGIKARDAGNMVKRAVEMGIQQSMKQNK